MPGVCNIGREEIKRRKKAGWTGLILALVAILLLWMLDAPKAWRLLVFIPVVASATGFIQAYNKFCVYFGFGHLFNFGDMGKSDNIEQKEFRTKDRTRAWQLLSYALGAGLVITVTVYFLL